VHSFRGLRTSDHGALLLFCYIFISLGRVVSGGCARAHPPGVAPKALEGCGTPSRALIERARCFSCDYGACEEPPSPCSMQGSDREATHLSVDPSRVPPRNGGGEPNHAILMLIFVNAHRKGIHKRTDIGEHFTWEIFPEYRICLSARRSMR
jgi:hypothetical protein